MPKAEVIAALQAARATLLSSIDGLSEDQMFQVGAVGLWSVKDVLAHLGAWESELVTALSTLDRRHAPHIVEIEDIDDWNLDQYHANVARPLAVILEDFHGVHKHLINAIDDLDNQTLDDNRRWSWMEGEPLSYLILENAIWHEEEHAEDIRAWREANHL